MPSQSRGFWCCDICSRAFDTFEEASYHETELCPKRLPQRNPQPQQSPYPSVRAWPQRDPYPSTMPPLSGQKPETIDYGQDVRSKQRCFPLLGLHDSTHMNEGDTTACRSLEVFEAGHEHARDPELRAQIGHIGLRCLHCAHDPMAVTKGAVYFPPSIESIAEGVHVFSDRHLADCAHAPAAVREISHRAAGKRRRADAEGSAAWQEEERSYLAMREYCFHICQRMEIVETPNKSGLVFIPYDASRRMEPAGHAPSPTDRFGQARPIGMGGHMAGDLVPTPMTKRRLERPPSHGAGEHPSSFPPTYGTPYGHAMGLHPSEGYFGTNEAQPANSSTPSQLGHKLEETYEPPPHQQMALPPPEAAAAAPTLQHEVPPNFPFFPETNGSWTCRYCAHIHPQYRDPQFLWSVPSRTPPPSQFIDQHLNMCRAYHQSSLQPQTMYQGRQGGYQYVSPQFPMSFPHHQTSWDTRSGGQGSQGHPAGPPMLYPPTHQGGELPPPIPSHMPPYSNVPHQMPHSSQFNDPHRGMMQRGSMNAPMQQNDSGDSAVQLAIEYLQKTDKEQFTPVKGRVDGGQLVVDEDRLLLTDYFFYLMKQLRLCRFSESDRKTRGGKREKIVIGFGGLQCIHCADANNSRKFFWSNVDRLANSFAEIPGHVLKCRQCPQQTKDALLQLKRRHPEQMARLPRGSQKVFFRRMWRRLHDEDPQPVLKPADGDSQSSRSPEEAKLSLEHEKPLEMKKRPGQDSSPAGTSGSEESILLLQRSTQEAAKALAESAMVSHPPSPTSRILLAIPEDKEWLSDTDCFIRRQIEIFCATKNDVTTARADRKYPVHEGQVGIRCIHCALAKEGPGASGSAVAFPFSISGIYESVREFQRLHLDTCENLPVDIKGRLSGLKGSTSLSSVLRKYYVLAAKALGLKDTRDGIRSGGDSVPLGSQAAFAFSDGSTVVSEEMARVSGSFAEDKQPEQSSQQESKKRKLSDSASDEQPTKKPYSDVKKEAEV